MLDVQIRQEGSVVVVTVGGKITFEAISQLSGALRDALSAHQPTRLVIDLENVTRIDSTGVGLLVSSQNSMNRNQGQLYLCGLCPHVMDVFQKMNLLNFFSVVATQKDALEGTETPSSHGETDDPARPAQAPSITLSAR